VIDLFHCFGAKPEHRVTPELAARMLRASRCRHLAVNTHAIDEVATGDDLSVGYADATLGKVRALMAPDVLVEPVLNINHPTSAAEAVARTRRAVELTGIKIIKLEVLDRSLTLSANDEVVAAARTLIQDGLEIWPLISADVVAYQASVDLGATMVRVMGSPIGARRGIGPDARAAIVEILRRHDVPVMLDGGIGSVEDVRDALGLGFDSVLVNSCLFAPGVDPVALLEEMRVVVDHARTVGSERQ
jgi:thiazole synthase